MSNTMHSPHYAHSREGSPPAEWHLLEAHLEGTSALAGRFAEDFGAGEWGRLAGLWHDLGKYLPEFQDMLRGAAREVDHSVVGALLAERKDKRLGLPLAFAIAGHHGGLPNLGSTDDGVPLLERLRDFRVRSFFTRPMPQAHWHERVSTPGLARLAA